MELRTGSKIGKLYAGWGGNQYTKVLGLSKTAHNVGLGVSALSAVTTIAQVATGDILPEKGGIDLAVTGLGAFAGPGGLVISGAKTFVEYQWGHDGGWGQMFRDAGNYYGNNVVGNTLITTGNWYSNYH